jgi:Protein of unknown function (DUF2690)
MPISCVSRWFVIGTTIACLGLASIGGSPALAATTCRGSSCNGKSPVAMGCVADAVNINQVVDQDNASGGTFGRQVVTLRYSRRCNASWSRVTATAGGTARVSSTVAYMGGYKSTTKRTRNGPGSTYSNMRAGSAINSCGTSSFNNGAVIKTNCATAG